MTSSTSSSIKSTTEHSRPHTTLDSKRRSSAACTAGSTTRGSARPISFLGHLRLVHRHRWCRAPSPQALRCSATPPTDISASGTPAGPGGFGAGFAPATSAGLVSAPTAPDVPDAAEFAPTAWISSRTAFSPMPAIRANSRRFPAVTHGAQRRHALGQPLLHRALARRKNTARSSMGPRPARQFLLRGHRRLPRGPPRRLRRRTTRHGPHAKPGQTAYAAPKAADFPARTPQATPARRPPCRIHPADKPTAVALRSHATTMAGVWHSGAGHHAEGRPPRRRRRQAKRGNATRAGGGGSRMRCRTVPANRSSGISPRSRAAWPGHRRRAMGVIGGLPTAGTAINDITHCADPG